MYVLLVIRDDNYTIPSIRGDFTGVREAQKYARAFREEHGVPGHENVEPTGEENEAWTDAGWYFGIWPVEK